MAAPLSISGALSKRDIKRLTSAIRSGTVGPTTLYYAGVTAPIIGAGMALVSRSALDDLQVSPYWLAMGSAFAAAFAGIVWYLIFMRWAYRHKHGRAGEIDTKTEIELDEEVLIVRRGLVETRIDWDAIDEIKSTRSFTLISFDGADPLMIPHDWFGEKTACEIFMRRLGQGMKAA
ncbi:MAG: YcxB family protein [Henriciella sp.]|nr:YcxB family protein [Hyphomonadaceae bacterium]